VRDEVIDDAVSAVALLRALPEVDPARVFVLGHSLGGYLAPRIAAADGRLAGMIVMAGAYDEPLGPLMLRQYDYILSVSEPADTAAIAAQRRMLAPMVASIGRLTAADSASRATILGGPASYWLDFTAYDPVAAMLAQREDVLILQGERDYQVTPAMLDAYLRRLVDRPRTTVRRFAGLSHLFVAGSGVPRPADYAVPGHVDAEVIRAIAEWIHR
jgi:dienelactone hydrolase